MRRKNGLQITAFTGVNGNPIPEKQGIKGLKEPFFLHR
jgi:hypothetical protein